jgi:hypothetical protein
MRQATLTLYGGWRANDLPLIIFHIVKSKFVLRNNGAGVFASDGDAPGGYFCHRLPWRIPAGRIICSCRLSCPAPPPRGR